VLLALYETRFGAVPPELVTAIQATHDRAVLRGWLMLVGSRTADEVVAAIRASRAS